MTYSPLDLAKKWASIVNKNVNIGRDSSLLKDALIKYTPYQILHGMYQYRGDEYISVPAFLKSVDQWLEDDEQWAEVLLAMDLSNIVPSDYYVYNDQSSGWDAESFLLAREARIRLYEWAKKVLV